MNKCIFLGNLTSDPELKTINGANKDVQVVTFRLAMNNSYKNKQTGEIVKQATFLDFEAWDTGAATIAKHFAKGDRMLVESEARVETWEDKETGQKRSKVKFRVTRFYFPSAAKQNGGGADEGFESTEE